LTEEQVAAVARADYVTFTSSSTVRFLLAELGGRAGLAGRFVSIGPVTSAALREHGLSPDVEAVRHDIDGLVEALLADASSRTR
jgi:uroporphyrinogen III methyltransferase/synthase